LEEPSAEEFLKRVLPKIIPNDVHLQFFAFEGKQDLEKQLVKKVRNWQMPDSKFLVMRDKDAADCETVKAGLVAKLQQTGKANDALVRIACHELESFYLGDLAAVGEALDLPQLEQLQNKARYRKPDAIVSPKEELKKITRNAYQQVAGSRAIAETLRLDGSNRSHSFNVLVDGVKKTDRRLNALGKNKKNLNPPWIGYHRL
jgi:hypothetical protein